VNASTGYVLGDQSYIAKTSDGGSTWTQFFIDPTNGNVPGNLKQVRFFNQKIGFVITSRNIYRTIDEGKTWRLHGTVPWDLTGIEIIDSTLYLYGAYGMIVKRGIKTFETDSLAFNSVTACGARLSATVGATFSTVDSVWFEYGVNDYDTAILASPFHLTDTSLKVTAIVSDLNENTNYTVRIKILYGGNYYYSNPVSFTTNTQQAPVISQNGGILYSSFAQGNQWYVNGILIPGATQASYTPPQSGSYTVKNTIGGCSSPFSLPFNYIVTGIIDPILSAGIHVFPNPVTNSINIQNDQLKKLEIRIFNATGSEVARQVTARRDNVFDMQHLPSGIYLVSIKDLKTSGGSYKMVIKL
jgi:hypothetical protein